MSKFSNCWKALAAKPAAMQTVSSVVVARQQNKRVCQMFASMNKVFVLRHQGATLCVFEALSFKPGIRSMFVWKFFLCVPALAYKAEPDFPQVRARADLHVAGLLTVLFVRALPKLPTVRGSGLHQLCSLASPNQRNWIGGKNLAQG